MARRLAWVFCAGESGLEREARLGFGLFHGAEALPWLFFAVLRVAALLLAAGRRAAGFFVAVFFVAVFFAGVFFAVAFLTAVFLAAVFLAAAFFAAVFFTAVFLAAVVPFVLRAPLEDLGFGVTALPATAVLAAPFLAEGFFAAGVRVVLFAVFLAAFLAAVFLAVRCAAVFPALRVVVSLAPAAAVLLVPVPFPALVFALAASCRRWYSRVAQRWPASPPQSSQAM
ncbi:hypothetical protein [Xanthomonas arboricola]|uniref:hypothetical protein n=1 Tax=Xanthomonas arboricola TaxID=56448 RepID=UPI001EE69768|nr:hypothetical protein [Xanthomonas arboricola]